LRACAPFGVDAERVELAAPERLHPRQPGLELREALPAQAVHPHARVVFDALLLDEAVQAQHAQVAAHRGGRQREGLGQLAGPARAVAQQLDDAAPDGVGQRG